MGLENRHRIGRQVFELQTPSAEAFGQWSRALPELFARSVQPALEQELDRLFPQGAAVQVDRLIIDLGTLPAVNFEQEFSKRLLRQLLDSLPGVSKNDTGSSGTFSSKTTDQALGYVTLSPEQKVWDTLRYFLQNGTLPWYAEASLRAADLEEMLLRTEFFDRAFPTLFREMQQSLGSEQTAMRLAGHFSEAFQHRALSVLLPDVPLVFFKKYKAVLLEASGMGATGHLQRDFVRLLWSVLAKRSESSAADVLADIAAAVFSQQQTSAGATRLVASKVAAIPTISPSERTLQKVLVKKLSAAHRSAGSATQARQDDGSLLRNTDLEKKSDIGNPKHGAAAPAEKPKPGATKRPSTQSSAQEDSLYVSLAGAVLLHPFLETFLNELGLLADRNFSSPEAQSLAVYLLGYLASGEYPEPEWNLVVPKLLCGMEPEALLELPPDFLPEWAALADELLQAAIGHWTALGGISPDGLRQTFLQRAGKAVRTDSGWAIYVEQKTEDILLHRLPWGISWVKLPWTDGFMQVYWQ